MKAYLVLKMMVKYQKKSKKELKAYCDAYLATGRITESQYEELVALIG